MIREELYQETKRSLDYIIEQYKSNEAVFIRMDKLEKELDKSDLNFIIIYQHLLNEVYTKLQIIREEQHFGEDDD